MPTTAATATLIDAGNRHVHLGGDESALALAFLIGTLRFLVEDDGLTPVRVARAVEAALDYAAGA